MNGDVLNISPLVAWVVALNMLLTFALTIPTTLLTTRFGVKLAHTLPKRVLETGFGIFLLTVCARFIWDMLG